MRALLNWERSFLLPKKIFQKVPKKYRHYQLLIHSCAIPDGSNTNPPLNAAFERLVVLPHCNASGHCCFVIAPIHPKIRNLRVRSNLKRAYGLRYKAKPAGNSDSYYQGL